MLRNYLTIAWRNLLRHKVFSLINILGLAIGMAACLLILQYVSFELSYDQFHANRDRVYRVSLKAWDGTGWVEDACGYNQAGPTMVADFPEVADYALLRFREKCNVSYGDTKFREGKVGVASEHFLTVFSFPLLQGNAATALEKPHTVVLSQSTARKYFERENPIGKVLKYNDGYYAALLTVTGVMQDMPANSHLHADILISYATSHDWRNWSYGWYGNQDYVYVQLKKGADVGLLAAKMPGFTQKYAKDAKEFHYALELQALPDIHLQSHKTYEAEPNGNAQMVYLLLTISVLILSIAWVNYINLSTARAVERAKEVGIRKVIGSSRTQLIRQFLLESLLINFFAIILAFTLFQFSLPILDTLTGKPMSQYAPEWYYWAGWGALFIIGSMLAGLYPALVLSGFQPIQVLKGSFAGTRQGVWLRKGLVVAQFAATVVLVIGTLMVFRQLQFMRNQDLGMNIDQTLGLYAPRLAGTDTLLPSRYDALTNELLQLPEVESVSITECLPGSGMNELNSTGNLRRTDVANPKSARFFNFGVDSSFFRTLGMRLVAGKTFSNRYSDSKIQQLIVNETTAKLLGYPSAQAAAGQLLRWGDTPTVIAGVVQDYHHHSLHKGYDPFVYYWDYNHFNATYLAIKLDPSVVQAENLPNVLAQVKKRWEQTFTQSPFDYFFLDERFSSQYKADQQFGRVFGLFAVLAIFVACLGLFGLVSLLTTQRTKEIGVRKVLGASVSNILFLLSKDFMKLILLANLIAWPLAYWGIRQWLENYAFRIPINPWLFLVPTLLVLLIALLTVGFQTWKAARQNPVKALRYE